jgi:hypothetical protein
VWTLSIADAKGNAVATEAGIEKLKRLRSGQPLIHHINPKTGY